jgi:hypothetical protein
MNLNKWVGWSNSGRRGHCGICGGLDAAGPARVVREKPRAQRRDRTLPSFREGEMLLSLLLAPFHISPLNQAVQRLHHLREWCFLPIPSNSLLHLLCLAFLLPVYPNIPTWIHHDWPWIPSFSGSLFLLPLRNIVTNDETHLRLELEAYTGVSACRRWNPDDFVAWHL